MGGLSELFFWYALVGTAVFAISGALLALRKGMDVVGVSFIAVVTGVGGGTVRDLLLGDTPVHWVREPLDIAVCIACAVVACALNRWLLGRRMDWLLYADAAGLALFAVLGAAKAEQASAHWLVAVLLGAMSATFGGIIRDIVCGERPILFAKELYITPALLGGAVFVALPGPLGFDLRALCGLAAALVLRLVAIRLSLSLPFPRYRAPLDE
ncbi:hypothetical protein B5C34_01775 [Pacificimonas flava]|uniref:Glycine transporter domain-containing protein n=2 Tax=Pacificimonas TaxID=1960290 RepID=A0A219B1W5_9SPHN|nr:MULTISPECIES: trimeric intracellular cation channel family protein [Pacificimonas]MBZ6378053.1 trimeric intracellular cation channel family protein [Pacificimonas aurantium]OWV32305.1 hypothetical protein B5C34_01775 [Pacificimonas flava]